ncbi:hypothetical protein PUN28_013766 [Cardiocondyla obscurior]|uniref:Uncharacterized protein n=1 Tax=Cardiocondyla obscurior TaxID=286306 RepID=A0AAW2F8R6_9HYME
MAETRVRAKGRENERTRSARGSAWIKRKRSWQRRAFTSFPSNRSRNSRLQNTDIAVFLHPGCRLYTRERACTWTGERRARDSVGEIQEAATARWRTRLVRDQIDIFANSPAAV